MIRYLNYAVLLIFFSPLVSCSAVDSSITGENYKIDYYSGGGFTGMESGITIFSDGAVKFWKRAPNSIRKITDSLKLSDEQIKKINDLLKDPVLFSYNSTFPGNYNTHLVITKDIQFNQITFNSSDPPIDMPSSVLDLIAVIKTIYKK